MTKKCITCKQDKDLCFFNKKSGRIGQHMSYCVECAKIRRKSLYKLTKEKEKKVRKEWYLKNKIKVAEYNKRYRKEHYKKDSNFRLGLNLRIRLNSHLKKSVGISGKNAYLEYLGCSILELKFYLESKFQPGMSWDNWSKDGWHIDHIIPLSSFDLSNREELLKACHYANLQPLWAKDNLCKGSKYE